ncbi:DUF4913 domain-containing protein [Streptomyces griseus]|uniref:DUF4913 domain-containing protein n=1 Tax=Streptomyces griseus TaxID=1911 RepID=UPI0036994E57
MRTRESPEYEDELRALTQWVENVPDSGYLAEPAADARWCHIWTEHPVAVARLHAFWLAWQELTDPPPAATSDPAPGTATTTTPPSTVETGA